LTVLIDAVETLISTPEIRFKLCDRDWNYQKRWDRNMNVQKV